MAVGFQSVQEEQRKAGGCGRQVPTQPSEVHERSGMSPGDTDLVIPKLSSI